MFGVPGPTEFDLRFRLLGIPVRVHPLFWVMAALLGGNPRDGTIFVVWIGCVFISVLVHEFGHALMARSHRADPDVLLYSFGGLCLYQNPREGLWQRFFVLVMGPGAGFLLMGAIILGVSAWLRISPYDVWQGRFVMSMPRGAAAAVLFLIEINFFWGLVNLLPIMPLDGGQIVMVFLTMHDRRQGRRRAYIVSFVTACLIAIYFARTEGSPYYNTILFGILAFTSFQVLQVLHHQSRLGGGYEDDSDWWRR